jgi:hypothetical protein
MSSQPSSIIIKVKAFRSFGSKILANFKKYGFKIIPRQN